MHNAMTMRIAQCVSQLGEDAIDFIEWKWSTGFHLIFERPCIKIAHHEVCDAIAFSIIEDRQNMWVLQFGNDARFLVKSCRELLAFRELTRQDLNRDITIYRRLIGFINSRHAPFSNLTDDAICAEHLPGLQVIHLLLQTV